jgi:hypothetical protein
MHSNTGSTGNDYVFAHEPPICETDELRLGQAVPHRVVSLQKAEVRPGAFYTPFYIPTHTKHPNTLSALQTRKTICSRALVLVRVYAHTFTHAYTRARTDLPSPLLRLIKENSRKSMK